MTREIVHIEIEIAIEIDSVTCYRFDPDLDSDFDPDGFGLPASGKSVNNVTRFIPGRNNRHLQVSVILSAGMDDVSALKDQNKYIQYYSHFSPQSADSA